MLLATVMCLSLGVTAAFGQGSSKTAELTEKTSIPASNKTSTDEQKSIAKDVPSFDDATVAKDEGQSSPAGTPRAPQQTASDAQELAKKLSNPIASLISVPFQHNFDFGMGPEEDGFRYTMNFQPVIPIALNKNWNLISRTIVPIIHQSDVIGRTSQTGLGDMVQSFFISPNKSEPFIWGAGPVLLIPTATDDFLGTEKFGLGPTVVALKQQGQWTIGGLWNHIWSVAGAGDRADVNSTFFQPFVSYTTKTAWTFGLNLESTYDFESHQWSIPVHLSASKLVKFGKQPVSIGGALRCWATSPSGAPKGCGFRFIFTPLFPKG